MLPKEFSIPSLPASAVTALRRPVCSMLGCKLPVVVASGDGLVRSGLVAAIAATGAFAFLDTFGLSTRAIRDEIVRIRSTTERRFGVALSPLITVPAALHAQVRCCIELRVPVVALLATTVPRVISHLRDVGILVAQQIGSLEEANVAATAGAHMLIARESRPSVARGTPGNRSGSLLSEIVEQIGIPVLAAGEIDTGMEFATALCLGAQGIVLGSRRAK